MMMIIEFGFNSSTILEIGRYIRREKERNTIQNEINLQINKSIPYYVQNKQLTWRNIYHKNLNLNLELIWIWNRKEGKKENKKRKRDLTIVDLFSNVVNQEQGNTIVDG